MPIDQQQLREDTIINGVLLHCVSLGVVRKIEGSPHVRFGVEERDGSVSSWSSTPTEQSLEHVSIEIDGRTRYFLRVNNQPEGKDGFSASAWVETDENGRPLDSGSGPELRICFNGLEAQEGDVRAAAAIEAGHLNFQVLQVPQFIDQTLRNCAQLGIASENVTISGHSLGAPSAMVARLYLKEVRGLDSQVILVEPWGEKPDIIARELSQPDSEMSRKIWGDRNPRLSEAQIGAMLNEDTVSINETNAGQEFTFINGWWFSDGKAMVGTQVQLDMGNQPVNGGAFSKHRMAVVVGRLQSYPNALTEVPPPATQSAATPSTDASTSQPTALLVAPEIVITAVNTYTIQSGDGLYAIARDQPPELRAKMEQAMKNVGIQAPSATQVTRGLAQLIANQNHIDDINKIRANSTLSIPTDITAEDVSYLAAAKPRDTSSGPVRST